MTTLAAVEQQQDLGSLIETYLTSCRIEGKSDETVRSYRETLDIFLQAVRDESLPQNPQSFTAAHVYQFLGHVANTGVSPITQWRRQRETRAFFSWLLRHDYIPANPFAKVKNIKVPQKIIHPFSQEDILRLLACCLWGCQYSIRVFHQLPRQECFGGYGYPPSFTINLFGVTRRS
jgi:site-specific recombinase XerD